MGQVSGHSMDWI